MRRPLRLGIRLAPARHPEEPRRLDFHNYYFIAKGLLQNGSGIHDHRAMEQLVRAELGAKGLPVFVYPPLINVRIGKQSRPSEG